MMEQISSKPPHSQDVTPHNISLHTCESSELLKNPHRTTASQQVLIYSAAMSLMEFKAHFSAVVHTEKLPLTPILDNVLQAQPKTT